MSGLHIPAAYPSDKPASADSVANVARFYRSSPLNGITDPQVGILLDYRDFARAVVERHAPKLYGEEARAAGEAIAIFVSRERALAEEVIAFMRKRFASGADPKALKRAVARLDTYYRVEICVADLLGPEHV